MDEEIQVTVASPSTRSPGAMAMIFAVIIAASVAMAGSGGALYWLAMSGRLTIPVVAAKVAAVAPPAPPRTHLVALEPLLVNLADSGGRSYLRIAMTLRVEDDADAKGKPANVYEAAERDAALTVMGRDNGAELLAPAGKEQLKEQLRRAFAQRVPEVKVVDILFTEFLVQQ